MLALPIGIGIATGDEISGNFGSPEHAEYSSIDMAVNLASRLGSTAEGDEILVDERTFQFLSRRLIATPLPPKHLKGFDQPMLVWQGSGLLEGKGNYSVFTNGPICTNLSSRTCVEHT